MPRILILAENPAHWDVILPILPWLEDAGSELRVPRSPTHPAAATLRDVARALDLPDPKLRRAHTGWGSRFDLALGTIDDLPLLRERPEPFVALARLPIPVCALSEPVPPPVEPSVQDARATRVGKLLTLAESPHKELAESVAGLPFVCTGCPELDQEDGGVAPAGRFVVLHPGDLITETEVGDESRKRHLRVLERLLTPLLALDRPIEIRTALAPGPEQDVAALEEALRSLASQHQIDLDRVSIHSYPAWHELTSARGVLALSYQDALRALGAGTARVWHLPFVRGELEAAQETSIDGLGISSWARFARWVEDRGWQRPSDDARRVARTLSERNDSRATERTAQLIMSVAEWDWSALEDLNG
jgi:hypothetical protein